MCFRFCHSPTTFSPPYPEKHTHISKRAQENSLFSFVTNNLVYFMQLASSILELPGAQSLIAMFLISYFFAELRLVAQFSHVLRKFESPFLTRIFLICGRSRSLKFLE